MVNSVWNVKKETHIRLVYKIVFAGMELTAVASGADKKTPPVSTSTVNRAELRR